MKLDRNITDPKRGKYALIKLRDPDAIRGTTLKTTEGEELVCVKTSAIDFGDTPDTEFFVIRLKDKYATEALFEYASRAMIDDAEYGFEVMELAIQARKHPNKKKPD